MWCGVERGGAVAGVREELGERLPGYMIPVAICGGGGVTGDGERKTRPIAEQLPAFDVVKPDLAHAFEPPQTPEENILAGIWTSLLGFEDIGRHDNFFDLGGDSILSVQIVARANQEGLNLTPQHVFQYQTIAELAKVAGLSRATLLDEELGALPLSPAQMLLLEQSTDNLPQLVRVTAWETKRRLNPDSLGLPADI